MSDGPPIRCTVAYALPERQYLWEVELACGATVADAIAAAHTQAAGLDVPWHSSRVGVFGEACAREAQLRDGDRIEIYRPLAADPRERRRERARARPPRT